MEGRLESDRPDYNKHPLLGALVWVLGKSGLIQQEDTSKCPDPPPQVQTGSKFAHAKRRNDYSNSESDSDDDNDSSSPPQPPPNLSKSENDLFNQRLNSWKDKRRQSWSDDSGHNLVEFFDENNRSPNNLNRVPSAGKLRSTLKTAKPPNNNMDMMKRSKGMGDHLGSRRNLNLMTSPTRQSLNCEDENDTLGEMRLSVSGEKSIKKNGYVSPQWGWYISTTPDAEKFPPNNTMGQQYFPPKHSPKSKNFIDAVKPPPALEIEIPFPQETLQHHTSNISNYNNSINNISKVHRGKTPPPPNSPITPMELQHIRDVTQKVKHININSSTSTSYYDVVEQELTKSDKI